MEDFDDNDFIRSANPRAWADAFMRVVRGNPDVLDEGFVLGWFANAMTYAKEPLELRKQIQDRELRAVGYYISHHLANTRLPVVELDTELERRLEAQLSADRSMLSFVREHMVRIESGDLS